MIRLKRAYEPASRADGVRILVERLWPRGVSKATLRLDAWIKEVAPTTDLRKWFGHDPAKWEDFRRRYFRELSIQAEAVKRIASAAKRQTVTLVYSSHDESHNNAVALQEYLERRLRGLRRHRHRPTASSKSDRRNPRSAPSRTA